MKAARRVVVIVASIVVAGGVLAAPATAAKRSLESWIRKSAVVTQREDSARFTGTFTLESETVSGSFTVDGVMDLSNGNAAFNLDLGGLSGVDATVEERVVDGVVYVDVGGLAEALGESTAELGGKRWVAVDPEAAGVQAQDVDPTGGNNPSTQLDALRGIDDVERVGTEELDGTSTTHFRGTIDLVKAEDRLSPEARHKLDSALGAYGHRYPVDVWLDDDHRVRKMSTTFTADVPGQGALTIDVDLELSDFGVDVAVEAPPAADTTNYSDLAQPAGPGAV